MQEAFSVLKFWSWRAHRKLLLHTTWLLVLVIVLALLNVMKPSCMQIGEPALPEHVSQTAGPLKGPHVLQIVQCIDVGHPSKGGVSGSSAKRC